jgi:hypothetical protein
MTEQLVIVGMRSDPEPQHIVLVLHSHCPVVKADADSPETSDLLEVE